MLTREQFSERLEASRREEIRLGALWLVLFFGVIIGLIPLFVWAEREKSQALSGGLLLVLLGFIGANVGLVVWYVRRRASRFGLICPACGAAVDGLAGKGVVLTNHCPRCNANVWR